MRIQTNQLMYGQSALKIREVCRQAMKERLWSFSKSELIQKVVLILNQSPCITKKVIEQLLIDEYLKMDEDHFEGQKRYCLIITEKGTRFGLATANKPLTRKKADEILSNLIIRAENINKNKELPYFIEKLVVFGSYLTESELLSDLDIGFKLSQRKSGEEFMELNNKRIAKKIAEGKHFNSFFERLWYPHHEIILLLKSRTKGLSLHDLESDDVFTFTTTKVVLEYNEQ